MFAQSSLPNENVSLHLQVEADQPVLSLDVATGRRIRLHWPGFGFGVLMLIGVSACVLVPMPSHDYAKPSRLVPEVANFVPDMSSLPTVPQNQQQHQQQQQLLPVSSMSATATKKSPVSQFRKAAAAPALGEVTEGLNQRRERQPISAIRMSGTAGMPLSRLAALRAAAAAYVLANKVPPALARAGEGTMSEKRLRQIEKELDEQYVSLEGTGEGTISEKRMRQIEKELDKQYVSLEGATERKFTSKTRNGYSYDNTEKGTYVGAISGEPIFRSSAGHLSFFGRTHFRTVPKYDSRYLTFYEAVPGSVIEQPDPQDYRQALINGFAVFKFWGYPVGNVRTEILDAKSGVHLGHVYTDKIIDTFSRADYQRLNQEDPTIFNSKTAFKRYSVEAAALTFVPGGSTSALTSALTTALTSALTSVPDLPP